MLKRKLIVSVFLLMLLLLADAQLSYGQVRYTSAGSGDWTVPATWVPTGVPGPLDIAVILPGDTVGLAPLGGVPVVAVAALVVDGTLIPHFPAATTGMTMVVFSPVIGIGVGGSILGEPGPVVGGSVMLLSPGMFFPFFPPGLFINDGTVTAGSGPIFGGSALVFFADGAATNNSLISGGSAGTLSGSAFVWATTALNADGGAPGPGTGIVGGSGFGGGAGGSATLLGASMPIGLVSSATNDANSLVRGGDGSPTSSGGSAFVLAFAFLSSPATNATGALIRGGDGCLPGTPFLFGSPTLNFGALVTGTDLCGPPPAPARMDPPEGVFSGDATMIGVSGEIAAGNLLTIGDLSNFPAINLTGDLTITLAPGGILDLTGLVAGQVVAGGNITVNADTILLPGGSSLASLMSTGGSLTQNSGARYALLSSSPDLQITLAPGQTLPFPTYVANIGNMPEVIDYDVVDTSGWIVSQSGSGTYAAMNGKDFLLTIFVPPDAIPGSTNVITISGQTQDAPVAQTTSQITIIVVGAQQFGPQYISPSGKATDVALDAQLEWNGGTGATSREVYFGNSDPPPLAITQTATTYDPGTLALDSTYYWSITEKGGPSGDVAGPVWSFTTTGVKCDPPLPGDTDGNCVMDLRDFLNMSFRWLDCNLEPSSLCP